MKPVTGQAGAPPPLRSPWQVSDKGIEKAIARRCCQRQGPCKALATGVLDGPVARPAGSVASGQPAQFLDVRQRRAQHVEGPIFLAIEPDAPRQPFHVDPVKHVLAGSQ